MVNDGSLKDAHKAQTKLAEVWAYPFESLLIHPVKFDMEKLRVHRYLVNLKKYKEILKQAIKLVCKRNFLIKETL